jgi:hypothetical protein
MCTDRHYVKQQNSKIEKNNNTTDFFFEGIEKLYFEHLSKIPLFVFQIK